MPTKKSEGRREVILDAALEIISAEGLRGLKYRTVAKQAKVPLGSTTYYFSGIEDLYLEAFERFQDLTRENTAHLKRTADKVLLQYLHQREQPGALVEMIEGLASLLADYIQHLVTAEVDYRKVEAAFTHAAIINPVIGKRLWQRQLLFLELSASWFRDFGTEAPEITAESFVAMINHLERRHMLSGEETFDREHAEKCMAYFFKGALLGELESDVPR